MIVQQISFPKYALGDKAYDNEILIQKYEGKKTILFATNYEIEKEKLRNIYISIFGYIT